MQATRKNRLTTSSLRRLAALAVTGAFTGVAAGGPFERSARATPPWLEVQNPNAPWALPDAPAPPTLPDLTHRALAASLETTFARIGTRPAGTDTPVASNSGLIERVELEQSLAKRRWYVGVSEEIAASTAVSGTGLLWVAGQPELWGRGVWASWAGLAYGGGLGVVAPLFAHGENGTRATESVRVVRPWDGVQFLNHAWALRPFVDVRQIDGPIILQLRQGLDWAIDTSGQGSTPQNPIAAAIRGSTELTSRTTFFIGYRPSSFFGIGLELWEVYAIKTRTATYAVSPSIRLMTPILQPALSVLAHIDRPLLGSVDSYWAVRINLGVVIDPVRIVKPDAERNPATLVPQAY